MGSSLILLRTREVVVQISVQTLAILTEVFVVFLNPSKQIPVGFMIFKVLRLLRHFKKQTIGKVQNKERSDIRSPTKIFRE